MKSRLGDPSLLAPVLALGREQALAQQSLDLRKGASPLAVNSGSLDQDLLDELGAAHKPTADRAHAKLGYVSSLRDAREGVQGIRSQVQQGSPERMARKTLRGSLRASSRASSIPARQSRKACLPPPLSIGTRSFSAASWHDATKLLSDKRTISIADQLHRAASAISGEVTSAGWRI